MQRADKQRNPRHRRVRLGGHRKRDADRVAHAKADSLRVRIAGKAERAARAEQDHQVYVVDKRAVQPRRQAEQIQRRGRRRRALFAAELLRQRRQNPRARHAQRRVDALRQQIQVCLGEQPFQHFQREDDAQLIGVNVKIIRHLVVQGGKIILRE